MLLKMLMSGRPLSSAVGRPQNGKEPQDTADQKCSTVKAHITGQTMSSTPTLSALGAASFGKRVTLWMRRWSVRKQPAWNTRSLEGSFTVTSILPMRRPEE